MGPCCLLSTDFTTHCTSHPCPCSSQRALSAQSANKSAWCFQQGENRPRGCPLTCFDFLTQRGTHLEYHPTPPRFPFGSPPASFAPWPLLSFRFWLLPSIPPLSFGLPSLPLWISPIPDLLSPLPSALPPTPASSPGSSPGSSLALSPGSSLASSPSPSPDLPRSPRHHRPHKIPRRRRKLK